MKKPISKPAMAQLVHKIVCKASGSDGVGRCHLYADAGAMVISTLTSKTATPIAGSVEVLIAPPDGYMLINATSGVSGEYHAWTTIIDKTNKVLTHVDFSVRNFRELKDRVVFLEGEPIQWTRQQPLPDFIWLDHGRRHPDIRFHYDEKATMRVRERPNVVNERNALRDALIAAMRR